MEIEYDFVQIRARIAESYFKENQFTGDSVMVFNSFVFYL